MHARAKVGLRPVCGHPGIRKHKEKENEMYLPKKLIAAMGGLALTASLGMAQSKQSADHMFVAKAANGGMAEVEMGQLAVQHASHAKVKGIRPKDGRRSFEG